MTIRLKKSGNIILSTLKIIIIMLFGVSKSVHSFFAHMITPIIFRIYGIVSGADVNSLVQLSFLIAIIAWIAREYNIYKREYDIYKYRRIS